MSESISFSIVIPTYNRKELVAKTIDSCLAQSYPNFEVIIVDDGGSDGTGEMISEKYPSSHAVRYFWKENAERGEARNYGCKNCSGDYIMFLDSDDLMEPNCLKNYYDHIIEQKYPEVIFSKFRFKRNERYFRSDVDNWKEGWYSWKVFLKGNYFASMICFRSNIDDIKVPGSLDLVTSEDWVFNLLKTYNKDFFFIEQLGFTMIEHDERSMNLDQLKIIKTKINACEFILRELDLSIAERNSLRSHANYFAAIHSYVGGLKKLGMDHLRKVGNEVSMVKRSILKLKLIIGRKTILKLRSFVS